MWKRLVAAAFLAALAGCGPNLTPFLGTWTVTGNTTITTGGNTQVLSGTSTPETWNMVMGHSATYDLLSVDSRGCRLDWSVAGDTATLGASQTCSIQTGGVPFVIVVTSGTMTLKAVRDGQLSATANLTGTCGGMNCTATGTGTLLKAP